MIDSTSFTSEPQYQRPDNRNSDMNFEPKPPLVIPLPPKRTLTSFSYDVTLPERFFGRLGHDIFRVGRLDYFGNAIPLGAFCFAITFITYGFYRCKVYKVNDTFLWAVILIFGGLGQVTAGFLEFLKGRVFPTALYLTMGFYCLTHYGLYVIPEWFGLTQNMSMLYNWTDGSLCAYYAGWTVIAFGLLMAAMKVNALFMLQCAFLLMGFLMRCSGEGTQSYVSKRHVAGILHVISGFFSLFIFISQMLNNETFYAPVFPSCPLSPYNDIDTYSLPGMVGATRVPQ